MRIAFDPILQRPGCAILQAVLGGSPGIANLFPSESWLTSPTTDMRVFTVTDDQLARLVAIARHEAPRTSAGSA